MSVLLHLPAAGDASETLLLPDAFLPEINASQGGSAVGFIPFELPPGFAPQLGLAYDSQYGEGLAGTGFHLIGFPGVRRDGRVALGYDERDSFTGPDGVFHAVGETFYRGRDNGGSLYERHGDARNPSGFTATTPEKTVYQYGLTEDAKLFAPEHGAFRVWRLSKAKDRNGNHYAVRYVHDRGTAYPQTVEYRSPSGATKRMVEFIYEERPGANSMSHQNSWAIMAKRLAEVSIYTAGNIVRRYRLSYSESPATGRSRLTALHAYEKDRTRWLLSLQWREGTVATFGWPVGTSGGCYGIPCRDIPADHFMSGDFNGDGLTDLLFRQGNLDVWLSRGDGTFAHPVGTPGGCYGIPCRDVPSDQFMLGDFNGDGLTDLCFVRAILTCGCLVGMAPLRIPWAHQAAVMEFRVVTFRWIN